PDFEALRVREPDGAKVHELFTRWEFKVFLRDPATAGAPAIAAKPPTEPAAAAPVTVNVEYETVLDAAKLDAWLERIKAAPLTAIDVAYTGVDPMQGQLVGIALAVEPERACYIPLAHRYAGAPAQLPLQATVERLKTWIESEHHKKLGHQLKLVA